MRVAERVAVRVVERVAVRVVERVAVRVTLRLRGRWGYGCAAGRTLRP